MLSLKVHHHEKLPGTQESRLVKTTPYVRLCRQDPVTKITAPPIYVQGGRAYGEGGPELATLPDWFEEEMAKLTPKLRDEVGWTGPATERAAGVAVASSSVREDVGSPPRSTWSCPECHKQMSTRNKGLHIARHRKGG